MTLPQRTPVSLPEAGTKTNVIELNTIKGAPRRNPYVFQVEPPVIASRPKPYVFPEERPDAEPDARPKVRLFDFLTSGRATEEAPSAPLPDPWTSLSERLDQAEDAEAVSEMLADLLSKLDALAEQRWQRHQRIVPRGAIALPPLAIAASLLLGYYGLAAAAQALGLGGLAGVAPWIAGILAVPSGLWATSLILGRTFRQVQPGEQLRFGELRGTVLESRRDAWRVTLDGFGPRLMPYYLAIYAAPQRVGPEDDHGSRTHEASKNGLE